MKKYIMSRVSIFMTFLVLHASVVCAADLPQDPTVVAGNAAINYHDKSLDINQGTDRVAINWDSFSIGSGYSVNFHQPGSGSVALNRVTGTDPSLIFGALTANGTVFIVNPNGVIFGANSRVDVNGLVASTLDIKNDDFMAGRYNFYRVPGTNGYVINNGRIVTNGGYVVLLSSAVTNEATGAILARLGTVVLAGGAEKATLALDDLGQISVVIDETVAKEVIGPDGKKIDTAVTNLGTIAADGGRIVLDAKVMREVFDHAINNEGLISAGSLVNRDGVIRLVSAGGDIINKGKVSADGSAENANAGKISLEGDSVLHEGELTADAYAGGTGGFIKLCALGELESYGRLSAAGDNAGEIILDPAGDITLSGSIAGNTTAWTTGNITLTGDVTIDGNYTLNIFADHKSATPGDWDDGVGDILNPGNFSIINGATATNSTLNLKSANTLGSAANPINTNVNNLSGETNPSSTGDAHIKQGGTALNVTSFITSGNIDITASGDLKVGSIATFGAGKTVTLSSGGAITNDGSPLNVFAPTLAVDAATGISLNTSADKLYSLVLTSGNINISNNKSLNVALAQAPGNVSILTTAGDITAGMITTGAGMAANLSAAGSILRDTAFTTNVTTGTLSADASSGINLNTSADNLYSFVLASGDINISNDKSLNVALAQAPGNVSIATTAGNLTAGTITAGTGMAANLSAAGSILRDTSLATNVTAGTLSADASSGINLNTSANTLYSLVTGAGNININNGKALQVALAQTSGAGNINITANGAVAANSIAAANGAVKVTANTGNIAVTNITSTNGTVSLNVPNGSITAVGAGPHITAGGNVTLTVPAGTVASNGTPLKSQLTNGNLILDIGGVNAGGLSGDLAGIVSAPGLIQINPATPGRIQFNGVTIWPLPAPASSEGNTNFAATTQAANEYTSLFILPTTQNLTNTQVSINVPKGPILFYHPLTEIDDSAYKQFALEAAAYDFIDGRINLKDTAGIRLH